MKQTLRRILTGKFFLIPIAALCFYSLTGFFLGPWLIGWYAPKFVKEHYQCRLDIGKMRINPFLLTFEASEVSFDTPEEPFAAFNRLFIDMEIIPLLKGVATFRELFLEKPTVYMTVYPDGSFNLAKFNPKPPVDGSSDSKPLHMLIQNCLVSGGTIIVTDKRQSCPASLNILELGLNATDISTLPDHSGTYLVSAQTPMGETFQSQGRITLAPFGSSGKLSFGAVQAATLWQFMKDSLNLESVTGKLDIATNYRLETGTSPLQLQFDGFQFGLLDLLMKLSGTDSIEFMDISLDLNNFSRTTPVSTRISSIGISLAAKIIAGSQQTQVLLENFSSELKEARIQFIEDAHPIFQTEKLTIEGGMLDLDAHSLSVSRVAINACTLNISRDQKGKINWLALFTPRIHAADTSGTGAVKQFQPSWDYRINAFEVDGFNANLSDLGITADKPFLNVHSFSCRLKDVDGKSPMGFEAGFLLKQGGTMAIRGIIDSAAPSVEAKVNLDDLSLTPLQPYLEPYAALTLQSCDVSLQGDIKYRLKSDGAKVSYSGRASLDKLLLTESNVEKTLIGWDSLTIPRVKLTLQPNMLDIDEIRLSTPTGEVILAEDLTLNLSKVFKAKTSRTNTAVTPESDTKQGREVFPIRIGKTEIEKGDMVFADLSLQPQFMTRIKDLKGRISGFSS